VYHARYVIHHVTVVMDVKHAIDVMVHVSRVRAVYHVSCATSHAIAVFHVKAVLNVKCALDVNLMWFLSKGVGWYEFPCWRG